jgi:hypothetical protein
MKHSCRVGDGCLLKPELTEPAAALILHSPEEERSRHFGAFGLPDFGIHHSSSLVPQRKLMAKVRFVLSTYGIVLLKSFCGRRHVYDVFRNRKNTLPTWKTHGLCLCDTLL